MENLKRRAVLSWASLALLAVLCCVLAILQYRWIDEISRAGRDRLKAGLQTALNRISHDFSSELTAACDALWPSTAEIEELGKQAAYAVRYSRWVDSGARDRLFNRIAVAEPQDDGAIRLHMFDVYARQFSPAEWPSSWISLRERLLGHLMQDQPGPYAPEDSTLIEIPRFGRDSTPGRPRAREQEWLILEVNPDYLRASLIPDLLQRHLGAAASTEYAVEIFTRADPAKIVYASGVSSKQRIEKPDASVGLFDIHPVMRPQHGWRRAGARSPGPRPFDPNRGRWQMAVQRQSGSLDGIIARARWRNVVLSASLLLLLFVTGYTLVRFSRQAHDLAELQMNFVAGVSHELRTPLTVIRTAAFNLRGRVARNPSQVEEYGTMIQRESEKLTALVEQVLQFSRARAGRAVRILEPVALERLIEAGLQSSMLASESAGYVVDRKLEPGLPPVLGDEVALRHAIRNLVDNALKYGTEPSNWIGISARTVSEGAVPEVEIRVSDRGPGIPHDEQEHIFDPFFRGRRALSDQIHGTGLGLNLVKKIVEAHGGSILVKSEPMQGAEFIMRLPAAPAETNADEFAHSAG